MIGPRDRKRLVAGLGLGALLGAPLDAWAGPPGAPRDDAAHVRIIPARFPQQAPSAFPERTDQQDPNIGEPLPSYDSQLTPEEIRRIDQELLENIQQIRSPDERVLALVRAAAYKTALKEFDVARRALDRASDSALQVSETLRRDLRLIGVAEHYARLAYEMVDLEALIEPASSSLLEEETPVQPERRLELIRSAYDCMQQAHRLAKLVTRTSYANEAFFSLSERSSNLGQSIGDVAIIRADSRQDLAIINKDLRELADAFIVQGAQISRENPSAPWRDRGLVAVVGSAADSNQFDRGLEIAGGIPTPEVRAEAMIRLAEAESLRASAAEATKAYQLAARAIASIHIADLRSTLANVLIDSLIAAGRFPDARRAIVLYPDTRRQLEALGAIAESMGSRGMGDQAREWINREVADQYRDQLLRQVNDGVLSSLENFRVETFVGGPRR